MVDPTNSLDSLDTSEPWVTSPDPRGHFHGSGDDSLECEVDSPNYLLWG